MNRAERKNITMRKYISRIKSWLPFIILDSNKTPESWKDAEKNCKWVKLLKHNKLYGRSTMNVLEKHFNIKKLRRESRKYEREAEGMVLQGEP